MTKILWKKGTKFAATLIAALFVFTAAFAFAGCESKRPEISIRISFNEETYDLEYELYRNMYPQTVAHYLELIEMDYFDGTVISDYLDDRMVGGGYTYEGEDIAEDLVEKDYDGATKDADGNVTLKNISVWADSGKETAYNTLYGEFSANGFTVENNGLTNALGALGTYYYTPEVTAGGAPTVYVQRNSDGEMDTRSYCYNAATDLFYLYTGSSGSDSKFCTFGLLKEGDKETFQSLLDAIEAYTLDVLNGGDEEGSEIFTTERQMIIEDEYWMENSYEDITFHIPRSKIVIEEIKVTKY